MKALLHVHSTFSYDGRSSVADLAAWGKHRGLDAILLSEHTNDFDADRMARLVHACREASLAGCEMVPGLEFSVRGGFHFLGYNVRSFRAELTPRDAVDFTQAQGGLAVLAHPGRYRGQWPDGEVLRCMDGIEAWNARYDGRFFPSGDVLRRIAGDWRSERPVRAFGGQDLHELGAGRLVATEAPSARTVSELIDCLRSGNATFGAWGVGVPMGEAPRAGLIRRAEAGRRVYLLARNLRNRLAGTRGSRVDRTVS